MLRILVDDAKVISGFEHGLLTNALYDIVGLFFFRDTDLHRIILNELLAAERERSFVLQGGVLIPHVPVESGCHAVWLRSVNGVPTSISTRSVTGTRNEERAYIIFCALAADSVLREIMGYGCEILRKETFRDQFRRAKTGSALREAISSHLRMTLDKHAERSNEDGPRHLSPIGFESDEILVAHALISNRRGLDARFSAGLVKLAMGLDCEVTVSARGCTVSGRSILGLMMLSVGPGNFVEVAVVGRDAEEAIEIIPQFLEGSPFSES